MPLLDHFHPPLRIDRPWEGFHSTWTTTIAEHLNESLLPPNFVALPQVSRGTSVEVDVATLRERDVASAGWSQSATGQAIAWRPSEPQLVGTLDTSHRDLFEVRIIEPAAGPRLIAAIELVSPANKDRATHRQAFAGKCAGYLRQQISLIVIDVVTERRECLHEPIQELLELDASLTFDPPLYAVAYRTTERDQALRLEMWCEQLRLGAVLPTLPLWLGDDLAVPLDLEQTYATACRRLRISVA